MIIRDNKIAIQHYTSNPTTIKVGERHYSWIPKNNVSLCWVEKEDVEQILKMKAKICCGKKKGKFFPASQVNVNIYETGAM